MLNYNILVNIGGIKDMNNYVPLHVHTELSLLDSCTNFKDYVSINPIILGKWENGIISNTAFFCASDKFS